MATHLGDDEDGDLCAHAHDDGDDGDGVDKDGESSLVIMLIHDFLTFLV